MTNVGLLSYLIELNVILHRDDIYYKLIKDINGLTYKDKIELLACQLMLFSEDYDKRYLKDAVYELICAVLETDIPDAHTSLAAIALLAQDKYILHKALDEAKEIVESKSNDDLDIVLAFMMHYHAYKNSDYIRIKRLLPFHEVAANYLDTLYYETRRNFGDAHLKPLSAFISNPTLPRYFKISNSIHSLSLIQHIVKHLEDDLLRESIDGESTEKLKTRLLTDIAECNKLLTDLLNIEDESYYKSEGMAKNRIRQLLDIADIAINRLFVRIVCRDYSTDAITNIIYENELAKIALNFCQNEYLVVAKAKKVAKWDNSGLKLDIKLHKDVVEWAKVNGNGHVVWDRRIKQIITDLIANSIYLEGKLANPWSELPDEADMWINMEYTDDSLILYFDNITEKSDKYLRENAKRGRWWHLEALGGSVYFRQIGNNHIRVEVKLPLAGCIQTVLQKGANNG